MCEYLYRYVSFESFVGMIQQQSLTFMLPEVWIDKKESAPFQHLVESCDNIYERLMLYAVHQKTYCQCWSRLAESDAMWQIYSYNNRAIRIRIKQCNVSHLDDVNVIPVEYSDDLMVEPKKGMEAYLYAISRKRVAFDHEKEVRLIKHYKFIGKDDLEKHIKALFVINDHPQKFEVLENLYPGLPLEAQIQGIVNFLNIGNERKKTLEISFADIPNFIDSILVHPLAPDWYVDIVREYCVRNNVPFDGRSQLYDI